MKIGKNKNKICRIVFAIYNALYSQQGGYIFQFVVFFVTMMWDCQSWK